MNPASYFLLFIALCTHLYSLFRGEEKNPDFAAHPQEKERKRTNGPRAFQRIYR